MSTVAGLPPRLENGDRMTRFEFHRRYERHPEIRKAELIEGVVHVPSPLSADRHGTPHALAIGWLFTYWRNHPELSVAGNATVILDTDNEVQPDAVLRRAAGGTSTVNDQGFIEGPPELVAEVAASSVSIDLHAKLDAYRRNGVREYVVWRVDDRALDWFVLEDGAYVRAELDSDGLVASTQFEGLRLDIKALLGGDADALARGVQ